MDENDFKHNASKLDIVKRLLIINRTQQISLVCNTNNIPINEITICALRLLAHQFKTILAAVADKTITPDNILDERLIDKLFSNVSTELDFILADEK